MVKNLRKLRREAGLSQRALAEEIGVSQQTMNRYENGTAEPNVQRLMALADYFRISVDELIGHDSLREESQS